VRVRVRSSEREFVRQKQGERRVNEGRFAAGGGGVMYSNHSRALNRDLPERS
jgi:hypothetical protein